MVDAIATMFDITRVAILPIWTTVDPSPALEAPVLEVATCTLRPEHTIEELESVLNKLIDAANTDKSPSSPILATSGRVVNKEGVVIFLMGWPNDQARHTGRRCDNMHNSYSLTGPGPMVQ